MDRFFSFDCNGDIVGNPRGYRTMRGALQQQDRRGSPAWRAIWAAYEARKIHDPENRLISSVHPLGLYA